MEIKVFSPKEFDKIEYSWKKLECGPDMTAFQLYDWYKNINALYFKEKIKNIFRKWVYVLAEENGEPVMIAPVQIVKFSIGYKWFGLPRAFYFIGRQGYTDYLNFIYKDFSEEAVKAILAYLEDKYNIHRCCFEQLLETASLYKFLSSNFKHDKYKCDCAALVLPETFEEYKKSLSKSTRQNIRTAVNRQHRDGKNLTHEMVYDIDDETADTLMRIRAERLPKKKRDCYKHASFKGKIYNFLRDTLVSVFSAKHDIMYENCNPWCFAVKDGNRIAGFYWGITNDSRTEYYIILAGVEEDYAWYSPSISHFYLYLEELYTSGNLSVKVIDFTRGGETYKKDLGAQTVIAYRVDFKFRLSGSL